MICANSSKRWTIRRWGAVSLDRRTARFTKWAFLACFVQLRRGTFPQAAPQELHEEMHGVMRKADVFWRAGWMAVLAVGWVLGASGCGSGDKSPATTSSASSKAHKKHSSTSDKPGEQSLDEMVAAVSAAKAGPPVELKFSLPTRPEVGQVMDIDVAVIPRAPVPDSVSVTFQIVDGMDIVEGAQIEQVSNLVDGTPIRHVVKVLPKRDGIFTLTAVVSFVSANLDSSRTFAIPVIAGEGLSEPVAKGP